MMMLPQEVDLAYRRFIEVLGHGFAAGADRGGL